MAFSLSLIDVLLYALVLQGFVISGLLFWSSKSIVSNRWLGALVFIVSDWVLNIEIGRINIFAGIPRWDLLSPHFSFAIGPVIYFYAKSLIADPQKAKSKNWLHFLPLMIDYKRQLIFLFANSGLLYIPFFERLYFKAFTQHLLFNTPIGTLFFISAVSYAIVTYAIVVKHQKNKDLSANKLKDLKWLKAILYVVFVCIGLVVYAWDRPSVGQYTMMLPLVAAVYVLGMAAWRRQTHMSAEDKEDYNKKPAKMYFIPDEANIYTQRLTELMATQQLYLNPVLKVEDVAAGLLMPEKTLSSLINQHLGKNFNDYVNEYRIAEAKQKLVDPRNRNFTIAGIAFDCGFNSLTTFQRVFKQFTGTTPSKFQQAKFSQELAIK